MAAENEIEGEEVALLRAIVALMLEAREERAAQQTDRKRAELLLHEAGLTRQQISSLLNKSTDAVRKTLERASRA